MFKKRERPEEKLQIAVVKAIGLLAPKVYTFHCPNGGIRSVSEAVRFKAAGVRKGVPDLILILSSGTIAFVELKAPGGKLSPEQKAFSNLCITRAVKWAQIEDVDQVETVLVAWGELPFRRPTREADYGSLPPYAEMSL